VGRSCVKDFLQTDSIDQFIWIESVIHFIAKFVADTDSEFKKGEIQFSPLYDLTYVLACAIRSIADNGFISQQQKKYTYQEPIASTCDLVRVMLNGNLFAGIPPYRPSQAEITEAQKIVEWAKKTTDESDYFHTIRKMAQVNKTRDKYLGFAVSIVPAYHKAMELALIAENKAQLQPSEYVGEVGERIVLKLIYLGKSSFSTYYGTATIYRFREGINNNVIWISNNCEHYDIGVQYFVRATIKKHEIYRDQKQTQLSRVKVIKVV
jgi:hypothetical protein